MSPLGVAAVAVVAERRGWKRAWRRLHTEEEQRAGGIRERCESYVAYAKASLPCFLPPPFGPLGDGREARRDLSLFRALTGAAWKEYALCLARVQRRSGVTPPDVGCVWVSIAF